MADSKVVLIPIVDNYYFSIDSLGNHTLYYKEVREKHELGNGGKPTGEFKEFREVIGFYPNMLWLYKALIADSAYRKICSGDVRKVEEYMAALEQMTARVEKIIEKP